MPTNAFRYAKKKEINFYGSLSSEYNSRIQLVERNGSISINDRSSLANKLYLKSGIFIKYKRKMSYMPNFF